MAHGINDNAVTMVVKSTLRNQHNIVLGLCSTDLLSTSGMNMMKIFNTKHLFGATYQDDNQETKQFDCTASFNYSNDDQCTVDKQIQLIFNEERVNDVFSLLIIC
ncbi:MAG: flavoprotein [Faecalibacillus faecis]